MDIKVPLLGEGADSGTVATVFVKPGDTIRKDDPIVELESEKAVASIPAPVGGKVTKIYVKTGDTVKVGAPLIALESADVPVKPVAQPVTKPVVEETPVGVEPAAAPSVRKLAQQLGIDLAQVRGSARGGRITLADVRGYVEQLQKPGTAPVAEKIDFAKWGPVTRKPLTGLRKVIAHRMQESWRMVARVTQFDEADLTVITELRKKYLPAYEKKGVRLTVTPLILKTVVGVLQKHPMFNASLDEAAGEVVLKEYFHLGMAVDTEQGLIVPVIRDVDKKPVLQLAKELEDLSVRARDRKVTAEEMKGGTFTISNQGAIGGGHFTPIVNVPEVAILGLGRATMKPVVRDGQIVARLMVPLALSYDHRLVDGALAARFIVDLVAVLEKFPEDQVKL
jgi:pyruvate dehydrogenase E2 component (dihydrolipoamide acetyltransferase)